MPKPGSLFKSIPKHVLESFTAADKPGTSTPASDIDSAAFHFSDESQVPGHLKKYYAQRYRYFSRYDEGCLLDEEGWYSVTPEALADQIAERCRCDVILDAFCGVGGNTIAFAKTCEHVIAIDNSPTRLALARHNARIYGVEDRIEFILGDYLHFLSSYAELPNTRRKIDVVFLSPPWGGPSYLTASTSQSTLESPQYSLNAMSPLHGAEIFTLTRAITPNIAFFVPRNTDIFEVAKLVPPDEKIEIEEEWMGSKLKALTCYFGGLVVGQEASFW